MLLRPVSVILLTLAASVLSCPNAVKNLCQCYEDVQTGMGHTIECTGQNLEDVIHLLVQHQEQIGLIKRLAIVDAPSIGNLTADAFKGLYIKSLAIRNSGVKNVDAKAFGGLDSTLIELDLSKNKIDVMPTKAINGMKSLMVLDLSNNSIVNLGAEYKMPTLPKLDQLNLANNKIKSLHTTFFDNVKNNIRSVNLGRNQLTSVPGAAIRSFRRLEALHLHGNQIGQLEPMAFMNLPVLNLLNLAHNKITNMTRQSILNIPHLKALYLSDNLLEEIIPHQFAPYEQLMLIDLSNNRIKELQGGSFADMKELKELYLANNRISSIKNGAFNNSAIQILYLEGNQLEEITDDMFSEMYFLEQLVLRENSIKSINQTAFHKTPNLVMLDLSHNKIFDLSPSTFTNQDRILLIDLQYNKILRTPYSAFSRRVVTVLFYENPLVCSEKVHMIQKGQALTVPDHHDTICGPQRELEQQNQILIASTTASPTTEVNTTPVQQTRSILDALPQNPKFNVQQSPIFNGEQNPVFNGQQNPMFAGQPLLPGVRQPTQEELFNAFKQAESDALSRPVPEDSLHDPKTPAPPVVIPALNGFDASGLFNSAPGNGMPMVIQRPKPEIAQPEGPRGSLMVRKLSSERRESAEERSVIRAERPVIQPTINQPQDRLPAEDDGREGGEEAQRPQFPVEQSSNQTPLSAEGVVTTTDIANIPGRIYPLPVPFLKQPIKQNTSVFSATLPPSIVIAPSQSDNIFEEFENRTATAKNRAMTTEKRPSTISLNDELNFNMVASNTEQQNADQTKVATTLIQGDKQLPNILTMVVVAVVGVVVAAILLGLIALYRRRHDANFVPSSANSASGGYGYPSNTLTRPLPPHHNYVHATNQFGNSHSQMSTLQRSRPSSQAFQSEDVYGWMYNQGPYQIYQSKPSA
ncbi:unnamed protein product [Bursaphelenchus okinawaensis]|uniref:LRRCT domain-containing protein n=1 Tax=Bursaphelenchus okinawaensis TaxID=465554 RepID=A0A811KJN3_9BILA|nr:unnamed protein product [Bursaphelenchus okinawaensis]CAG9105999.1 unnamed protein product [Bursaphelenchus okinawaensis]